VLEHGRFFVPGPTEVRPEILQAMARPMIFHRTPEMEALMRRVTAGLGDIFGTRRTVHVLGGSGTSAMELAVRSGSVRRILAIIHGDFGERFAKLAESCSREVTRVACAVGETVPLEKIRAALESGSYDAVLATHNETATGVVADIGGIARLVRERENCLFLVDSVSGAGGMPFRMDEWGVDAVVSASQKAIGLPPGLAFAAASQRLIDRAKTLTDRGTYLDVLRYEEFAGKAQSPTTPPVSLLFALDEQIAFITRETLPGRFARHIAMRDACVGWVRKAQASGLGVSLAAGPDVLSPTVTCIRIPGGNTPVLDAMRKRGYELGGGQGELVKTSFRVGHMGDHTVGGMTAMLDVLDEVLRQIH
jgi:aspartate aminotransferase-like enzyme